MWLTMQHICEWAHTSPSERNYREGESILSVGHLLKCGKLLNSENDPNVKVVAFCMQTSQMRSDPHKINGEISKSGIIISMDCSCKAGLGDTCKHIIATLLNCHRVSFNDLETISCTDQKCCWKEEHKKKLDEYTPRPLAEHACYKLKYSDNKYLVSSDTALIQEQIIFKFLPLSAFAKHRLGRHKAIAGYHPEEVRVSSNARKAMQIIFAHQSNSIMRRIQELNCGPLKPCCAVRYANLHGDNQSICENTMLNCNSWKSERQMRITGSTCYSLYTYTKSRKQDWAKKCANHFNPVNFTSEYTQHGLVTESKARDDFAALFGKDVVQTGLVVSKENPWLGVSPDGVIFNNDKPTHLLEIKCPFKGKTMKVEDAVQCTSECKNSIFKDENEVYYMKPKHKYYGQVQLGMTVINVCNAFFVIYASYDRSLIVIEVPLDETFVYDMLHRLKYMYFNVMLHQMCLRESDKSKENESANGKKCYV